MSGAPLPPRVRVPERALWVNGRICRGAEAALSLFDRGARDGEGLFETLAVHDGRPWAWTRHMERLVLSAAELGFPVPPSTAELAQALRELLAAERMSDAVARITVTRGVPGGRPTRAGCWIDLEPLEGRRWAGTRRGAATAVTSRLAFEPGPLGRHKTTSRLAWSLAREEARAARVDEALLTTATGEVLEGAASNVFVVRDGAVRTPPLARGVLPGVTRALVLEWCVALGIDAREGTLWREDLRQADEVFLTNSVQRVVPLASIDGLPVPARAITARLQTSCAAAIASGLEPSLGPAPATPPL